MTRISFFLKKITRYNSGYTEGHAEGYNTGHTEGYRKGHLEGSSAIRKHYESEKKNALQKEIAKKKAYERKLLLEKKKLLSSSMFDISDSEINQYLDKLHSICKETNTPKPTDDQINIIINKSRNITVSAGAGSGKSTTLFQRIYFMNQYLRIPLSQITIFSFTVASTNEFRKGLQKVYSKMGVELSDEKVKSIIRTFHSKIYEFERQHSGSGKDIFEFFDDKTVDEASAEERAMKLDSTSTLSSQQLTILKNVFGHIYSNNSQFKSTIDIMFKAFLRSEYNSKTKYPNNVFENHKDRDSALNAIVKQFYADELNEFDEVDVSLSGEFRAFSVKGFKCKKTNRIFFCTLGKDEIKTMKSKENGGKWIKRYDDNYKFNLLGSYSIKIKLISNYLNENYYIADNIDKLKLVKSLIKNEGNLNSSDVIKIFKIQLQGDRKPQSIFELLYSAGSYIEIMGMKPMDILTKSSTSKLNEMDKLFCQALTIYWSQLSLYLEKTNTTRFGEMFSKFSEGNPDNLDRLKNGPLRTMKHIIIDEFQDISPDVVKWIRGVLKANTRLGIKGSILTVGDDAQSIYSWKGSTPEFLSDYKYHFNSESITELKLRHNFRSSESIIRIAESALQFADDIQKKTDTPCKKDNEFSRVELIESVDANDLLDQLEMEIKTSSDDSDFMVLSSSRITEKTGIDDLKSAALKRPIIKKNIKRISFHTFYTSKGLEADTCLLFGDTGYSDEFPFRNIVVEASMIRNSNSYDDMQSNEARRLIYVALSRAKNNLVWFRGVKKSNSVYEEIQETNWKSRVKGKGLGI
jgi:superfamily I DNA/RNA helicase